jgi:hypothetical protein
VMARVKVKMNRMMKLIMTMIAEKRIFEMKEIENLNEN